MTPLIRWTLLATLAIASCNDASSTAPTRELPSPDGPRLVFLIAPGLNDSILSRAQRSGLTPSLVQLSHRAVLRPPIPGHPAAVLASVTSGVAPSEHGHFDGTARVGNQYARVDDPTVTPSRVFDGEVRPPRFESHSEVEPFWSGLAAAGVPLSVLFAPRAMPLEESGARVLAGDLPNVVGRRAGALLFVRPDEIPRPPPPPVTEDRGRRGRREARRRGRADADDAGAALAPRPVSSVEDPGEGEGEDDEAGPDAGSSAALPSAPLPDGVQTMRELSAGVWLAELPLRVTGFEGELKRLIAQVVVREQGDSAVVQAGEREIELLPGERSPWVPVRFAADALEVDAQTRFHLLSRSPLRVVVEDPTVDPYDPFYSISTPPNLVASVAGRAGPGPFTDPGVLRSEARRFTDLEFRIARLVDDCQWRADALIAELETTDSRVLLLFVDAIEQARLIDPETGGPELGAATQAVVSAFDRSVARVRSRLRPTDTLVVVSPLALPRATRQVDLNAWLRQKRYLRVRRDGAIDWPKSQAYAAGEGTIYLNVKGREPSGSVPANRAGRLAKKIARELRGLRDRGAKVVREVWLGDEALAGTKRSLAPEVMVAFEPGFTATKTLTVTPGDEVFDDTLGVSVPVTAEEGAGFVLASRPLAVEEARAMDVAATAHAFVGVARANETGRAWFAPPAP